MQLSQNQEIVSQIFSASPDYTYYLEYFEKKYEPRKLFLSEIIDCKIQGYLNAQKVAYQNTNGLSEF